MEKAPHTLAASIKQGFDELQRRLRLSACLAVAFLLVFLLMGATRASHRRVERDHSITIEAIGRQRDRAAQARAQALHALDGTTSTMLALRHTLRQSRMELQRARRANETHFEESKRAWWTAGRLQQQLAVTNTSWAARARRQSVSFQLISLPILAGLCSV